MGSKGKKKSESGHLAYQIEGKEVKTNMQVKTLTLHTPLSSGIGLKGQILNYADN